MEASRPLSLQMQPSVFFPSFTDRVLSFPFIPPKICVCLVLNQPCQYAKGHQELFLSTYHMPDPVFRHSAYIVPFNPNLIPQWVDIISSFLLQMQLGHSELYFVQQKQQCSQEKSNSDSLHFKTPTFTYRSGACHSVLGLRDVSLARLV